MAYRSPSLPQRFVSPGTLSTLRLGASLNQILYNAVEGLSNCRCVLDSQGFGCLFVRASFLALDQVSANVFIRSLLFPTEQVSHN
jgi:hypothetical protein